MKGVFCRERYYGLAKGTYLRAGRAKLPRQSLIGSGKVASASTTSTQQGHVESNKDCWKWTATHSTQGPNNSLYLRSEWSRTYANLTASLSSRQQQRHFSVSAAEVEKFNAMHADWWNPSKNPLISMNTTRIQYIRQQISSNLAPSSTTKNGDATVPKQLSAAALAPLANIRAVDLGCGGGLLSESLARLGASVTGIDPSVDLLAAAQRHADLTLDDEALQRLEYRNTTAEALAAEHPGQFDVVCLLEVVEHVKDPASLLEAASTLLRPGGMFFLSTMNRTWKAHVMTITGAEYIMGLLPPGTHDWNLYRSPAEVRALVEPCGMREVDTSGMVLAHPPLLSYNWRLDPNDTDVNWIGSYIKAL